jgi:ABC-2 type transport system ATP-binding protein
VGWALGFVEGYFGAPAGARAGVVEALSLRPLLDKRIGQLSKGQRKRALLGLGMLTSRRLVLADEPFDGLDLKQTREMAAALRSFARADRTLVLSIHQINDAARVCDRFVLLSGGTVRGVGTVDEVMTLARRAAGTASAPGTIETLEEAFLALT